MNKQIFATPNAPQAIGPYSQAVKVNGFIFISGQLPINPASGKIESQMIEDQAHQSLKNIKAIVENAGLTLDNIVKTTILLKDIYDFKAVNEVYAQYFTKDFPARATYQVAALPLDSKIEIEAIAAE